VRAFSKPRVEDFHGSGEACSSESEFNAISFEGSGAVSTTSEQDARIELRATLFNPFTSNKSAVVEQSGFTVVGMGNAESVISQAAADRVAGVIAIRQGESELGRVVPPVLSAGIE
jgi:hypothetical protein